MQELNKEVNEEEVKEAIISMRRNKTPGPNGFTALFYKIMKEEKSLVLMELIKVVVQEKKFQGRGLKYILL